MQLEGLKITPRRGEAQPEPIEGGVRLQGEVVWKIEGPQDRLEAIREALPESVTEILGSCLLLSFGNAVGRFSVPSLGCIEVTSGKWTERDFEKMLAELTEQLSALPFAAGEAAKIPYDRQLAQRLDVLYQAFVYLRHILSDVAPRDVRLQPALQAIIKEPHSRMVTTTKRVRLESACSLDSRYFARLASGVEPLQRAEGELRELPLAVALNGHLPEEVEERYPRQNLDTAENRFVKSFLELCVAIMERMERIARKKAPETRFWARVLDACVVMAQQLEPFRRSWIWESVGRMTHLPAGSTILQARRGYRDVYRHFVRLRSTTRIPLSQTELEDLLEAKDIAELYELWCYFRVVSLVTDCLGRKPVSASRYRITDLDVGVPWGFRVEWLDGTRCYYNLSYSRSRRKSRRSYSVPLRPDIVLEVPSGPNKGSHVFDAKFRVRRISAWDSEDDDRASEERRGTFKRADLYKMHTYRDALAGVQSVWILYPGDKMRFFPSDKRSSAEVGLPTVLSGVGAAPLVPDTMSPEIRTAMNILLGAT